MKIVLLGIQGAGKSTQGNLLSQQLKLPYLSTGHIFRRMAQEKTKWGRFIKETMAAGHLISDQETIKIVNEYLQKKEYQNGYILDGFPRNLKQAKKFMFSPDYVIYLKVKEKEALWRIAGRQDNARNDETLTAVRKRIDIFYKVTKPVTKYYQKLGILIEVDGSRSIKEVNEFILKSLGKTLGRNGITNWRKRSKIILAIVGLPGAGKTTATEFFKKKKIPSIRLGAITDEILAKRKLPNNKVNNRNIREEIRKKHGMDVYIKLNIEKLNKMLEQSSIVVIDGMRSYEEYLAAQKAFSNVFLLAIAADKKIRYSRIKKRPDRAGLRGEDRDTQEVLKLNMGPTIALADAIVMNNGSEEDFESNLEEIYKQVYYGIV